MANHYRLKIVKGDEEFEAEGDKTFVLKMADLYANRDKQGSAAPLVAIRKAAGVRESKQQANRTDKQMSVREFIQKLGFKKHTDIVLAFGYFLEHSLGKSSFTPADVNNLYYEAKLEPSNTSQAFIYNIRRSQMMEDKKAGAQKTGRKAYTLTQTGEKFILNKLDRPVA